MNTMRATLDPPAGRAEDCFGPALGAETRPGGVFFRVWAPKRREVRLVLEDRGRSIAMEREPGGYFSAFVAETAAGAPYRFLLDGEGPFPDPCSRSQPEGPHGPSVVVDPSAFEWTDAGWKGIRLKGQVFYELHVGAFTREGTFEAVIGHLDRLKRVGVTTIELMPVAEFPGRFNWGYDGVSLFAPSHVYGGPDGLKRLIDAAHARGLGVILDVVYNHLGPDGNYLPCFSDSYVTDRHSNDWGPSIDFDGPESAGTREFFVGNACHWIREYRFDGLRLDATQNIHDDGPVHVLSELSRKVRAAAGGRGVVIVGENEPQDVRCVAPVEKGGWGLDAIWSDDFHHAARVALTGRREAYFTDYAGTPQEFVSLAKRGVLYQGQYYSWQKQNRGVPVTSEPAAAFVFYLENHDQLANSLRGARLGALSDPAGLRALTAYLLLVPETPLLFMGQETGSTSPFTFFADHAEPLRRDVEKGRRTFLSQFPSVAAALSTVADPASADAFSRCVLEPYARPEAARLYEDLLRLRREDPVVSSQDRKLLDGAVLGPEAFVLRFEGGGGTRLLAINLGTEFDFFPASEPLLAPPSASREWRLRWSSEEARYGGGGVVDARRDGAWRLPGRTAVFYDTAENGGAS